MILRQCRSQISPLEFGIWFFMIWAISSGSIADYIDLSEFAEWAKTDQGSDYLNPGYDSIMSAQLQSLLNRFFEMKVGSEAESDSAYCAGAGDPIRVECGVFHDYWDCGDELLLHSKHHCWHNPSSAQEVFELIPASAARQLRDKRFENLATLFTQAVAQICQIVETPYNIYFDQALNCVRVLTRVLPFLLEKGAYIHAMVHAFCVAPFCSRSQSLSFPTLRIFGVDP